MDILEKLDDLIQEILEDTFTGSKTELKKTNYSYQFACPYCGDSLSNDRKKRAHLYFDSINFHCYNCSTHKSLFNFLNDFGKMNNFTYEELDTIDSEMKKNTEAHNSIKSKINLDILFDNAMINSVAISRNDAKQFFDLIEVKGTPAERYLRDRMQFDFEHYLFSKEYNSIWILNRTRTGKIIGVQMRMLGKTQNKYYTYSILELYKKMNLGVTDNVKAIENISTIFNILNVDFTKTVKVLEGAFDAYLLDNAIAKSGSYKKLPFIFENMVFLDDYDTTGIKHANKMINDGLRIFLWQKFLEDHRDLGLNQTKKIDITDVIKAARRNGVTLQPLSKYYSKDKYDAYFL